MVFSHLLITLVLSALVHTATSSCPAVRKCLAALEKGNECPLLPVPKDNIPSPPPPTGFSIKELRSGVYSWNDGAYFSMILYKERRLTLIDFPFADSVFRNGTYLLNTAVRKIVGKTRPIRLDMVYGHRHPDHIGGAQLFYSFIMKRYPGMKTFVWGTDETREAQARNELPPLPKINVLVGDNGRTVNLAPSLNVKLIVVGGHVVSDLAAHIPPSKDGPGILHFVDVVTPGFAPFLDFALTIDLLRYIAAHKRVLKLPFKIFSGGHGQIGDAEDVRLNLQYTEDVLKFAREAADEVTQEQLLAAGIAGVADPTKPQFGNTGFAIKVIIDLQGAVCTRKLIEKYGCVLGSVDIFASSHCKEAFFYTFTD